MILKNKKIMSILRFISDLHFGHKNMAERRGFKNVEEHDKYIITQWNSVVNKRDTVWILGDITMQKSSNYYLLNELNGIKKIVLGNHDQPQHIPNLLKYVNKVCGIKSLSHKNYSKVFLTHCPIHLSELEYRVKYNIHGHVHENSINDNRYINVSCEVIDYKPKTIEELFKSKNKL